MGKTQSKPETPEGPFESGSARPIPIPRNPFLREPWRTIKGWDESTRDDMKSEIMSLKTTPLHGVPTFNIILTGQIGAGKSSFYNSINSIFSNFVRPTKAAAGKKGKSFTRKFKMYTFRHNPYIRIGDTMGIDADSTEADIRNILNVVEGHVPNGYKFHPDEEFLSSNLDYIANPSPAERAHCVALVINAKDISIMKDVMVRKLQSLADGLHSRGLPIVVVLTHLDLFHPEVGCDITKTFHSRLLMELVNKISLVVNGLPENQIFPIINYNSAVELNARMDILLLYALRCMIGAAEDHLDTKEDTKEATAQSLSVAELRTKFMNLSTS